MVSLLFLFLLLLLLLLIAFFFYPYLFIFFIFIFLLFIESYAPCGDIGVLVRLNLFQLDYRFVILVYDQVVRFIRRESNLNGFTDKAVRTFIGLTVDRYGGIIFDFSFNGDLECSVQLFLCHSFDGTGC